MTTFVSRNTIHLGAGASAVNNYYVNHKVILSRVNSVGSETVQSKVIVAYNGTSKIATIDSLWQADFTPAPGDTFKIVPLYSDSRVSINPAIQTLDYITSKTYGRGLEPTKDLKLETWLNSARICDTRSDIYVSITGAVPSVGDVYTIGAALWQGKVAEVVDSKYVRFTDNIGKLSYTWNSWRNYTAGTRIHHQRRLYSVQSGGVKTIEPTHTSGTVDGLTLLTTNTLTKVSGAGPATLSTVVDGNPIRFEKAGVPVSGYTLYDSDGIDYFRLIGWDSPEQREVTRHQTNLSVDTSLPLFDNTNSMLQHFGGILRYSGDKYILEIEEKADPIANIDDEPRNITADHIIGKINISDEGIRGAYNSLTVAYSDPANKFEARNISFFNSEYLKADRNTPKKGNLTIPGVTNYYNARILADKYLTRSRYGLSINLNLAPRGALLLAGKVIQLQYPRYGWVNKKFRIENLTHNDDCTVDIVATEYDDSFYIISNIAKAAAIGVAGESAMTTLSPPSGLRTTSLTNGNELISAIELVWNDSVGADSPRVTTQIYGSYSPFLVVNVSSITGGQTFTTTQNPHGLDVGQKIVANTTGNGLTADAVYYVKTVTANTFTLANSKGGSTLTSFTNTTTAFTMTTATIIATVKPPTNSYVDTVFDIAGSRVQKYYWLRYKID